MICQLVLLYGCTSCDSPGTDTLLLAERYKLYKPEEGAPSQVVQPFMSWSLLIITQLRDLNAKRKRSREAMTGGTSLSQLFRLAAKEPGNRDIAQLRVEAERLRATSQLEQQQLATSLQSATHDLGR